MFGPIDYLAVGIATIIHFGVGAVWFGVLFGKAWQAQMNWSPEETEKMKKRMPQTMVLSLLASFLVAYAGARILVLASPAGIIDAVMLSLLCSIGFAFIKALQDVAYEGDSWTLFGINAAYYVVSFMAVFVLLFYWPK